jgi:DNA-binding transcriptional LysR family regulator
VHAGAAADVRLLPLPEDPHRSIFTAARSSRGSHPALAAVREALAAEAADLTFR